MPASGVVQTTLDGSFAIPGVAPGSYYVIVTASGYLSPHPRDDNSDDSDDAQAPLPGTKPPVTIPRVDLTADQTAPPSDKRSTDHGLGPGRTSARIQADLEKIKIRIPAVQQITGQKPT